MPLSLILPAPADAVSGGYAYDRRIVAGLREAGHTVEIVELLGSHPLADAAARDAARSAWDRLPDTARPIIDGLALPAFDGMDDLLSAGNAAGIIHHPTALETGFSDNERVKIDGKDNYQALRSSAGVTIDVSGLTVRHSPGGITYIVRGLAHPVAVVGDAVFAGSMGGGGISYEDALFTNKKEIFALPNDTIICPGHGPLTTVGEELKHNPFYAK